MAETVGKIFAEDVKLETVEQDDSIVEPEIQPEIEETDKKSNKK